MEVNLPVWKYYEDGFVDPMYVPYQKSWTQIRNNCGDCVDWPTNTWQKFPIGGGLASAGQTRRGRGLTFQLEHPDDPCPMGWKRADCGEVDTGYCVKEELEFEPVFYTEKAFIPKNQYWNGYDSCSKGYNSEKLNCPKKGCGIDGDALSMRSISPYTGKWMPYKGKPNKTTSKYATAGTPSSYLA